MSEMVERLARIMFLDEPGPYTPAADHVDEHWRTYEALARELIAAMREPTEAMTAVGGNFIDDDCETLARTIWQAMIDGAIGEGIGDEYAPPSMGPIRDVSLERPIYEIMTRSGNEFQVNMVNADTAEEAKEVFAAESDAEITMVREMRISGLKGRLSRTIAMIATRYDAHREQILRRIREGKDSASMSGIEYFPKAWADLDMADPYDAEIVAANLKSRNP